MTESSTPGYQPPNLRIVQRRQLCSSEAKQFRPERSPRLSRKLDMVNVDPPECLQFANKTRVVRIGRKHDGQIFASPARRTQFRPPPLVAEPLGPDAFLDDFDALLVRVNDVPPDATQVDEIALAQMHAHERLTSASRAEQGVQQLVGNVVNLGVETEVDADC